MEPVTLIVSALVAGASAAAKDTAGQAIKDAYQGLKSLLQKRFAGQPKAEAALAEHEQDPETYEKPLQKALTETNAADDEAIRQKAQELMGLVDPQGAAQGKYSVQITGNVQGFIQGDNAQQTNTYNT